MLNKEISLSLMPSILAGRLCGAYLHDQRNILSTLAFSLSTLFRDIGKTGKFKESEQLLRSIESRVEHLEELAIDMQRLVLERPPYMLNPLGDVIELVNRLALCLAGNKQVRLTVSASPEAAAMEVPSSTLVALMNITICALESTPHRGCVELQAGMKEGAVEISVSNTGPGVPDHVRYRMWDLLVETSAGNMALGLHFSREWEKEVGASISLDSSDEHGARVVMTIPRREV